MLRHRAGLSQAVLAERVGVTRTSITNLEQGTQRPPLYSLLLIAAALELPDYRTLLPSPEELAVASPGSADEVMAVDHPFWIHVRDVLRRTFSSPMERMVLGRTSADFVEVWVDDLNPLRPETLLIVVRPRPQLVRRAEVAEVAARVTEVRASRGVLITSGTVEPDAAAAAAETSLTLIDGAAVAHLQRTLGAVRGHIPPALGMPFSHQPQKVR